MKVIISAGGTGGHIYPALAMINKIKSMEPDSEFLYIGTHNRMEKEIVPKNNIPFQSIEIYGFNRKNILKNFKTINCLFKSYRKCKKIIKEFNPDVVIGVGGYVTVPVILAANKLGYKTVIHEQNSVPGASNEFLAKRADLIMVSFSSSIKYFDEYKTVFTGNPCSTDALNALAIDKRDFNLDPSKKLVLIVMGSLGASKINDFLVKTMSLFNKKDYEEVSKNEFPSNVHVVPYIDKMTRVLKKTDVIVSRAGASTLSEIIALNTPSILIPSPYVANNHQYKNAMDLVNRGSAMLIEEKDLNGDILVRKIDEMLENSDIYKNNLKKLFISNSGDKIYNNIKKLVDRK